MNLQLMDGFAKEVGEIIGNILLSYIRILFLAGTSLLFSSTALACHTNATDCDYMHWYLCVL
jgi:hypothetical protein